jgi:hypothetical protein
MINSSLHQNIIAAEGGWIVTIRHSVTSRAISFHPLKKRVFSGENQPDEAE